MNSFGLSFLEEAAGRKWPADSRKIGLKLASAPQRIQAFSDRDGNKIKVIEGSGKYFLTISNQHFGTNKRCEPNEWLH
jgi:hypothetical protein